MMITFDFNPETNEYKPIKQEIIKETIKKSTTKVENTTNEPTLTLESNKYVLNKAAVELMNVEWGSRLFIGYKTVNSIVYPVIGTDEAWETQCGNKLTKNFTVSCKGSSNEILSRYGKIFTLSKLKENENLFILIGDTNIEADDNIELPSKETEIDKTEETVSNNMAFSIPDTDLEVEDMLNSTDNFDIEVDNFNFD